LTQVNVRRGEPIERALRRFKKKIDKEGIIRQIKRHESYEKPSQRKRRKRLRAIIKRKIAEQENL